VERWIVGPDTDQTLEVKLSPHDHFLLEDLRNSVSQSDRRVILYMARSIGKWWLVREVGGDLGRPSDGIEILSTSEALHRIPAISREAEVASPDSLAAQADIVIVGSLGRHTSHAPSVTCRVERVVSGTMTDSTLTVVTERRMDLHEGRALLMLKAEPDGTWRVLNDGAGCYFLDRDRTAHYATSPEAVFARLADARARRVGRDGRR
jgi:hypothetical protein